MDQAESELALVREALTCNLSNAVEWVDDRAANRVRNDPANQGLTPDGIKQLVREHVRNGGEMHQRKEEREDWRGKRDYWYFVVVPVDGFRHGLFVEMELLDPDPDCPMVALLNAHPERK